MQRLSYQFGRTDITAVLQAIQENILTENQYLSALSEYQQAFTDLEQAVGLPLE